MSLLKKRSFPTEENRRKNDGSVGNPSEVVRRKNASRESNFRRFTDGNYRLITDGPHFRRQLILINI